MLKEIVEFMFLENNSLKFLDIIFENRLLAKGLHIIVDKDSFEIKDFVYNDDSESFKNFIKKYDLKKREYYCQVKGRGSKNFTNSCFDSKNQIHSNSPYSLFFKLKPSNGVFKSDDINNRFSDLKTKWIGVTNYFDKLISNFDDKSEKKEKFVKNLELYKRLLNIEFYKENDFIQHLDALKKDDYIQIYTNDELETIIEYYDYFMQEKIFAKEIFKNSSMTLEKYNCPILNKNTNLGLSSFYSSYGDKKPLVQHLSISKLYEGYSSIYSKEVVKTLFFFQELLKLKILPNPFPIFISSKDAVDNIGNKLYFDLLENNEPISYKQIIKKVYEKLSDSNEINNLNFYLIFWNLQNGLNIYDVDYVDNFQYKLKDFKVENIFDIKDFNHGVIESLFELEWKFFAKFFYTSDKNKNEINYLLQKNYFTEKIDIPKHEEITSIVSTKLYQYNKSIYDFIYKSKLESINSFMFDDICIPIIKEQIKLNNDWNETYKIKEKLSIYFSLYKNFNKGENLATQIEELKSTIESLLDDGEAHLKNDKEFAFASGQLIWFILKQNQSENKTHSLLDIFISKNKCDDFKMIIAQNIQKYSHTLKFFESEDWFGKLASEAMGYDLEQNTIKSLIPLIMAGYFSNNVIWERIKKQKKQVETNNKNGDNENGKQ